MARTVDGGECLSDVGWTFHKNYAQTVAINSDAEDYLILSLRVGGFHGIELQAQHKQQQAAQVAQLTFEFETRCSSAQCQFALLRVCCTLTISVCSVHCVSKNLNF